MANRPPLEWLAILAMTGIVLVGLVGLMPWPDVWLLMQKDKAADWVQAIVSALAIVAGAVAVWWQAHRQRLETARLPWLKELEQLRGAMAALLVADLMVVVPAEQLRANGDLRAYFSDGLFDPRRFVHLRALLKRMAEREETRVDVSLSLVDAGATLEQVEGLLSHFSGHSGRVVVGTTEGWLENFDKALFAIRQSRKVIEVIADHLEASLR